MWTLTTWSADQSSGIQNAGDAEVAEAQQQERVAGISELKRSG